MDGEVNQVLFEHYSNTLRKAVSGHFADGLDDQLRANLTRFAAYKAAHAQKTIASFIQEHKENEARACIKQMDTWLDAEYNTAVARARTAKQFAEFLAPDNPFRNLRWLPSRSADPRAAHVKFYNRIWAKGDSFWDTHSPGTEWNCKCDLEETNEPATDAGDSELHVPRGLEGNPAKTGEIYTDEASYIRGISKNTDGQENVRKSIRDIFRTEKANENITIDTSKGRVMLGEVTFIEISKGAKTDKSYYYKMEIAQNIGKYCSKLQLIDDKQEVDLGHNNHKSPFYHLKKLFTHFEVYRLDIKDYSYQIKMGVFRDGTKYLYCITEPSEW